MVVGFRRWSFAQFRHQAHVLFVNLGLVVVSRYRRTTLSRSLAATILGDVTSSSTSGTYDVVRNVRFVRTEPSLVLVRATVRTPWSVRFTQRSVELGQFSQLHPPQIVVTLRNFDTLPDNVLDALDGLLHRFRIARRNERVQRFVLPGQRLTILPANLTLLHRSLAPDDDLRSGILLHGLQRVSTRSNQQPDKVDVRMFLLRNQHLVADANNRRFVVRRGFKFRIHTLHALNQLVALLLELLPRTELARVQPLAVAAVDRFRRWRSGNWKKREEIERLKRASSNLKFNQKLISEFKIKSFIRISVCLVEERFSLISSFFSFLNKNRH